MSEEIAEVRPNPEELLEAIKREDTKSRKGRLKVFLGMAAGVGKTFAMLDAAQRLKREKLDIVVGTVETHGRIETAKLLEGLTVIPEKKVQYKNTLFKELDLDEILKRKPQLVIVDELAHSNVPGSRHPKRWQDVAEILDQGIDVFTTLNVQHIESLKDVVESVTGISIRETVPDLILETAAFIELVDITPDELLGRLKDGKVYLGEQSIIAARNFFQEDRLTALRELVLRYAAEKVDHDLRGMVSDVERKDVWKTRERLLVAVSHSPHSQKLIRTTRRIAFTMDAPWTALHVDDGKSLDETEKALLAKNLALARELGAEVVTTADSDLAQGIQRIARQKRVTQIVIGRPPKRRFLDFFFRKRELLDRLAKECTEVDVHVIRQAPVSSVYKPTWDFSWLPKKPLTYLFSFFSVLLMVVINFVIAPFIGYLATGFVFLLGVLILGLFFKRGPVFLASLLSAIAWGFLFIPLKESLDITSGKSIGLLSLYAVTVIFVGLFTGRLGWQKDLLAKQEKSTLALYEIVRGIAASPSSKEILESFKQRLGDALDGKCEVIVKKIDDDLKFDRSLSLIDDEKEKGVAKWVFENGKEAGWSTTTLPMGKNLHIPLKGLSEVMGVLVFRSNTGKDFTIEELNLLHTAVQQLANHLERCCAEEKQRKFEQLNQIERIYHSVLGLISSQFQPPLKAIKEAIIEIKQQKIFKENKGETRSVSRIESSSEGLFRFLKNISAMAKLSSGIIPINKGSHSIRSLITSCCENIKKSANHHTIKIRIQENLPDFFFDYSLMELLVHNLLFNATEYSPSESLIEVEAKLVDRILVLSVSDEGEGIPQEMLGVVFEKFYRIPGTTSSGLGLGLAIAKTIAEMHQGELKAENRSDKGTKFSLLLPV